MAALDVMPFSKVVESAGEVGASVSEAVASLAGGMTYTETHSLLFSWEAYCEVTAPEAWVEFLPEVVMVPCAAVDEGVTEAEVAALARVVPAAVLVSLGEVTATLVVVSLPEVVTTVLRGVVVVGLAAVVVTMDVEFAFEIVESFAVATPLTGIVVRATGVVPVADSLFLTPTWVVAPLFVLFAV